MSTRLYWGWKCLMSLRWWLTASPALCPQMLHNAAATGKHLLLVSAYSQCVCASVCLCVCVGNVQCTCLSFCSQSVCPLSCPYTCPQRRLLGGSHPHLSAVTRNESRCTPIHQAAQHGHLHCLKFLVHQAPPKAVQLWDGDCNTPTLLAIQVGGGQRGEWGGEGPPL